jgi:hypothetical protein
VANLGHLDKGIFATARKEMLYDDKIYLILHKGIEMNTFMNTVIYDEDHHGIVSTGNCYC